MHIKSYFHPFGPMRYLWHLDISLVSWHLAISHMALFSELLPLWYLQDELMPWWGTIAQIPSILEMQLVLPDQTCLGSTGRCPGSSLKGFFQCVATVLLSRSHFKRHFLAFLPFEGLLCPTCRSICDLVFLSLAQLILNSGMQIWAPLSWNWNLDQLLFS